MRLSTSMIYQQNLDSITQSYAKWQSSAKQLATGKRVNAPSDDPIAASQAVKLNQNQGINSQYSAARVSATASLSTESTVVTQVVSAITGAKTLLVQAGNGTLSDDDRQSLATNLQSYKDQLLTLANTKDGNDNYLFAGYKTETAPFVSAEDGSVSYVGGSEAVNLQVDASRSMSVGNTGAQVFTQLTSGYTKEPDGSSSEANIFNTLDTAIKALQTPQAGGDDSTSAAYTASIDKATRGLANALNNVSSIQGSIGSKLNELETLDSIGTDRTTQYKDQLTSLTGVDYYQAISDHSMQQVALQAAYSTFKSMQQTSLFSNS